MTLHDAFNRWNTARAARNKMSRYADKMSRHHNKPAKKRVGLIHAYYLYAVKDFRMKAEDIAEKRRDKGYNTLVVEFNKKRTSYGVYVN